MAFVIKDRVRETTITTGTGPVTLAGAAGGYQTFSAVMSIGDTCWYSIILPGSAWETGIGTYTSANVLTRTTILESSNAGAAVSFIAGTKDIFVSQPASKAQAFLAGTLLVFQQTAAPLYWTKQVTHNDKALRVVSGAASSGGSNSFSSVNAQTVVGNTTIGISTLPAHTHGIPGFVPNALNLNYASSGSQGGQGVGTGTDAGTGSGNPHNHTITMAIQYVDLIIAMKD